MTERTEIRTSAELSIKSPEMNVISYEAMCKSEIGKNTDNTSLLSEYCQDTTCWD